MRANDARILMQQIAATYFVNASVYLAEQSRAAKPPLGLVTIKTGTVKRQTMPTYTEVDGELIGNYQSSMSVTIDLFTHGLAAQKNNATIGYYNTAVEDMLAFMNFLESRYVTYWCRLNDVAFVLNGEVQDLTGILNEHSYEYRARIELMMYFTQRSIGYTGVPAEQSVKYPVFVIDPNTGEVMRDAEGNPIIATDPETGEPIYTTVPPVETTSRSGGWKTVAQETEEHAIVQPVFIETSTGGGSQELATAEDGYFTEVEEIKEEDPE